MAHQWLPVTVPVEVALEEPITVLRWPSREWHQPPDDGGVLPAAVGAWCRIVVRFDGRWVRSKTLKAKVVMSSDEPTEDEWLAAEAEARASVASVLAGHGCRSEGE